MWVLGNSPSHQPGQSRRTIPYRCAQPGAMGPGVFGCRAAAIGHPVSCQRGLTSAACWSIMPLDPFALCVFLMFLWQEVEL